MKRIAEEVRNEKPAQARKYQHEYDIKTQKKKNGIGDHKRSKSIKSTGITEPS